MSKELKKAIFLDRDGVINHDPGDYTRSIGEFTILPGVLKFLKSRTDEGYVVIVITNQGGIAKGEYGFKEFYEIDSYMANVFLDAGINYIETYFCPHHDVISKCLCRKPSSGMLEKAIHRHGIDPERSVMIGDKWRDIEAGEGAGVRGIKIDVNQDLNSLDANF
ncbi:MAG TPA: HAD family hydrolase [Cryomorphaceae bacterium]|nr:HAD family hydrolase [Cryomorphaceae bacterium]